MRTDFPKDSQSFSLTTSSGVKLVHLREDFEKPLFEAVNQNRDVLAQWLPWVKHTQSSKNTLDFIRDTQAKFESRTGFTLAIMDQDMIRGCIGIHEIDWINERASLGYWLSPMSQKKGIATDAVRTLTQFCFHTLRLTRMEIYCAVENQKSRGVAERAGYHLEGILKKREKMGPHSFYDHALYACTQ